MLEPFEFIFWEALKLFALVVMALVAGKAARSFVGSRAGIRGLALYGGILALVAIGARALGQDVAAEAYGWASAKNLDHHQYLLAYSNASRAVELRPGLLRYWQLLARAKFAVRQYRSVLGDEGAFRALSPQGLDEDDLIRLAYCRYFTGQYLQVIPLTDELLRRNPAYPKTYVLEGLAKVGARQYPEAERDLLQALKLLPTQADAVEALAHAYFLAGDTGAAVAVLDATGHYTFSRDERRHFEALKALYEQ